MKVLQLIQKPQLRGAEVFTSQLSNHLNHSGHQAILVCLFPGTAELPFEGKILHLGASIKRRLFDFKAYKRLAQIIKEEQPSLIQANAGDTLKYAVLSKLLFSWKQPIVFRNASTISLYIKSGISKSYNNFFFKHACRIISVSKASANDFANLYPDYKKKIVTVPIGIESTHGTEKPDNKLEGKPAIIHVGGFTYEKNHAGLLSIFEELIKDYPAAILHLVGSGPLQHQIESMSKVKGLKNNVIFHNYQTNALEFIRRADVLVLPSIIEGLPGVILEAFYCKTPVVAYDVGGIKEVLINNKTGRLVDKNNESEFRNAIVSSIQFSGLNEAMVENAYSLVNREYLNKTIATKFLGIYESILN